MSGDVLTSDKLGVIGDCDPDTFAPPETCVDPYADTGFLLFLPSERELLRAPVTTPALEVLLRRFLVVEVEADRGLGLDELSDRESI